MRQPAARYKIPRLTMREIAEGRDTQKLGAAVEMQHHELQKQPCRIEPQAKLTAGFLVGDRTGELPVGRRVCRVFSRYVVLQCSVVDLHAT